MHPRVVARIPNVLGDLLAWGRDAEGWWGLVIWTDRRDEGPTLGGSVTYSAWMPARSLRQSSDQTLAAAYRSVVRLDLPPDRSAWPTPADRADLSSVHHGVLGRPPTPDAQRRPGARLDPDADVTASSTEPELPVTTWPTTSTS